MKKTIFLLFMFMLIPFYNNAQPIENLDFISSFHDGLAAIKKDNQWAFINKEGEIVIDFRKDLVTTKCEDGDYPIFKDGRCIIVNKNNGISYYGYIDQNGKLAVEPQFLNASNFNNNVAIVLKLIKEELGKNEALGKNIVNYKYFEVTIDPNGNIKNYLTTKGINVVLDKKFLIKPPQFTTKLISENLYMVLNENRTWTIHKMN